MVLEFEAEKLLVWGDKNDFEFELFANKEEECSKCVEEEEENKATRKEKNGLW